MATYNVAGHSWKQASRTDRLAGHTGAGVELPVLRDPENSYYVRQEGEGLIVGPFGRRPLTWALDGVLAGSAGACCRRT